MSNSGIKHTYFTLKAKRMIKEREDCVTKVIPNKPMNEWKVAFLTTAGVHLKTQKPFDVEAGDHTVHFIGNTATPEELMITHTHYDTSDAKVDINCVFPLQIINDLKDEAIIGQVAETHYGMMGFIPEVNKLEEESIPLIIDQLKKEKVDVLLASPG